MQSIEIIKINELIFDRKQFLTIVSIVFISNLIHGLFCLIFFNSFLVFSPIVLGVTYAISIWSKLKKPVLNLIIIATLFALTWFVSSFIIRAMFKIQFSPYSSWRDYIGYIKDIASSIFSSIAIVLIINHFSSIHFKFLTILFTSIFAVASLLVYSSIRHNDEYSFLNIYFIWQTFTSIPIALGLTLKSNQPHKKLFSNAIIYFFIILIIAFRLFLSIF